MEEAPPMLPLREMAATAMRHAERKFLSNDPAGAAASADWARCLLPSLPGVVPAMTAYHVHATAAAGRRHRGLVDPHAVLGVRRTDSLDAVKKQFKRLCLLTHPDKNPSPAADGAFKLVKEAWDSVRSRPSAGTTQDTASASTACPYCGEKSRRPGSDPTCGDVLCDLEHFLTAVKRGIRE